MAGFGLSQKPIVMPHYPHMLAEDTAVWSKYLAAPVVPITEVWYDVHVGRGMVPAADADGMLERIARGISRKRIDVVAKVPKGLWVVEIKPFGGMQALGQVVSYWRLFVEEFEPAVEVWPVIVCAEADGDLLGEFDSLGVVVISVG